MKSLQQSRQELEKHVDALVMEREMIRKQLAAARQARPDEIKVRLFSFHFLFLLYANYIFELFFPSCVEMWYSFCPSQLPITVCLDWFCFSYCFFPTDTEIYRGQLVTYTDTSESVVTDWVNDMNTAQSE
jgi:hypothetical protein